MRIWMEEHYGEKDHFALKITLYLFAAPCICDYDAGWCDLAGAVF